MWTGASVPTTARIPSVMVNWLPGSAGSIQWGRAGTAAIT